MGNLLLVSPSPHVHGHYTTRRLMFDVLIALCPAWLVGVYYFGLGAVLVTLISVVSCVGLEYVFQRFVLRVRPTVSDGSAALTGLLLALNVPSNLPWWIVVIGAFMAIVVGKISFGGLGNNLFNPALFARAFMLVSFPTQMTSWPIPGQSRWAYTDAETGATLLSHLKAAAKGAGLDRVAESIPETMDLLIGNMGGSLGEVSSIALVLGFAYLLARRVITWHIPVSILLTVCVFSGLLHVSAGDVYPSPLVEVTAGGLLLGAIFMATDYVTSPMSKRGMLLFGFGIGVLTMVIRAWGAYPEGVSFAILIMNAFVPLINRYMKPRKFGVVKTKGGK